MFTKLNIFLGILISVFTFYNIHAQNNDDCEFISTPIQASEFGIEEQWISSSDANDFDIPLVGDLDGDGIPEIVTTKDNPTPNADEVTHLKIFSGLDGTLLETINVAEGINKKNHHLAIGELTGDNLREIVVNTSDGSVHCYTYGNSTPIWEFSGVDNTADEFGSPSIADFNGDGNAEIYIGSRILNGQNGTNIVSGTENTGFNANINDAYLTVAMDVLDFNDLRDNGEPCGNDCNGLELVAGNQVYAVNIDAGTMTVVRDLNNYPVTTALNTDFIGDGLTRVVDLDVDGDLEVVVTRKTSVHGASYVYAWNIENPMSFFKDFLLNANIIGAANIANFDSDEALEIGLTSGVYETSTLPESQQYIVFKINGSGAFPLNPVWSFDIVDSTKETGATVFDFNGDGIFEILHRDENNLRILHTGIGSTLLEVLASIPCSSHTAMEHPVVADIDNDGHTEIVCNCDDKLRTFRSNNLPWVPSRPVWNQANYHIANVNDDLTIPVVPMSLPELFTDLPPEEYALYNNFITQLPALDENNNIIIGDLDIDAVDITYSCPNDQIIIALNLCNQGTADLPPSIPIVVYDTDPTLGQANVLSNTFLTNMPIAVDECITQVITVNGLIENVCIVANDNGSLNTPFSLDDFPIMEINECFFDNNLICGETMLDTNVDANAGENVTICVGQDTQLNATGGVSYSWFPETNLDDPNIANPIVLDLTTTTTYTVTVTNSSGCFNTDEVTVFVESMPLLNPITVEVLICDDNQDILVASLNNGLMPNTGIAYTWTPTTGLNNPNIINPVANISQTTTYILTATNAGCTVTQEITLHMPIAVASADVTICEGETTILTATNLDDIGDLNGTTYEWSTGETGNSIEVSPLSVTTYTVSVFSDNGCFDTDEVIVSVLPPPSVDAGNDVTICAGEPTTLTATNLDDINNIGGTYVWSTFETTQQITVFPTTTTTYYAVIIDSNGCIGSDQVTVTVAEAPTVDAGNDVTICQGDVATLFATGSATQYEWSTGQIGQSIAVSPNETTTYTVTATDDNGCSSTDDVTVTVIKPAFILPITTELRDCDDGTYLILINQGMTPIPTFTYQWTPTTGLNNPNILDPTATITETTTYTLTVSNGACSTTASVTIDPAAFEILDAGFTADNISLGSFIFNPEANPVDVDHFWDFGDGSTSTEENPTHQYAASGLYQVCHTVTAEGYCPVEYCEWIEACVKTDFVIPEVICEGILTTFISPVSNADQYIWSVDGVQDVSATTHIFTTALTAGQHTIGLTIIMGNCEYYSEHTVIVSEEPDANFTFQSSDLTYSFVADIDDPSATYNWDFGDGSLPQTGYLPTIDYTYSAEGNYIVNLTVTNECGTAHSCVPITVCDLEVTVDIEGEACGNTQLIFNPNMTGIGATGNLNYQWVISNNSGTYTSTESSLVLGVTLGTYVIELTVSNEQGCSATYTETLVIEDCPEIIGEVGDVVVTQQDENTWHTVYLQNTYTRPAVVMSPASFNDEDPMTVRVRNVQSNSFEYQIDEWDYMNDNGFHESEKISYIVVEQGVHTLSNGEKIIAGNPKLRSTWRNFNISHLYTFNRKPIILSQCITTNDPDAVITRVKNVTPSSFSMTLQEEEGSQTPHQTEKVSIILMEQGMQAEDLKFEIKKASNNATSNWSNINFEQMYSANAIFLAKAQTANDKNPMCLRTKNLTSSSIEIFAQEEYSADYETIHNDEVVGYAVFDYPSLIEGALHSGKTMAFNPFEESEEETAETSIICHIMPNPSDGIFMLEVYSQETAISHLTLTDVSGKVLFEETNIELNEYFRKQINLEQYPTGIYFLNVNGENASHTEKIVVY